MLILTLRTDKPEAEVGLYGANKQLAYLTWQAHRQLAETIHQKIADALDSQTKQLSDLQGLLIFKGPGSFTGLRIGISVANTLAAGLKIPIVGETGESWIAQGLTRLADNQNDQLVIPEYGALPHITTPKK